MTKQDISERELAKLIKKAESQPIVPPTDDLLKNHDRFTLVMNAHHETHGEQPKAVRIAFSDILETVQEPYFRRVTIPQEKTKLDTSWVKGEEVGYILIENREGRGLLTKPDDKQREEISNAILRISTEGSEKGWLVRPGRVFLARPEDASKVWLEGVNSEVKINLHVFPK